MTIQDALGLSTEREGHLVTRLLALPEEIDGARMVYIDAKLAVDRCRSRVQELEDRALMDGACNGSNEAVRKAQARAFSQSERKRLEQAEVELQEAERRLKRLEDDFRAYRAAAWVVREAHRED